MNKCTGIKISNGINSAILPNEASVAVSEEELWEDEGFDDWDEGWD